MKFFALLSLSVVAISAEHGWVFNEKDGSIMVSLKGKASQDKPAKMTANKWENSIKGLKSAEKLGVKSWAMLEKKESDGKTQQFLVGVKKSAEEMAKKAITEQDEAIVFAAEKHSDSELKLIPQHPAGKSKTALEKAKSPLKKKAADEDEEMPEVEPKAMKKKAAAEDEEMPEQLDEVKVATKKAISKAKSPLKKKASNEDEEMPEQPNTVEVAAKKAISKAKKAIGESESFDNDIEDGEEDGDASAQSASESSDNNEEEEEKEDSSAQLERDAKKKPAKAVSKGRKALEVVVKKKPTKANSKAKVANKKNTIKTAIKAASKPTKVASKSLEVKAKSANKKTAIKTASKPIKAVSKSLEVKAKIAKKPTIKTAIKAISKPRNLEGKAKHMKAHKAHVSFLEVSKDKKMDPVTATVVAAGAVATAWAPFWGVGWALGWPMYPFFSDSSSSLEKSVTQLASDLATLESDMGLEKDKKMMDPISAAAWGVWGAGIYYGAAWYGAAWAGLL